MTSSPGLSRPGFIISDFEFRIFGHALGNGPRSPEVPGIPIRLESACILSGSALRNGPRGIPVAPRRSIGTAMETLTDSGADSDGGRSLVVAMETVLCEPKPEGRLRRRPAAVLNLS